MNVVDSSGWLEYFSEGENAANFAPVIEDQAKLVVPSITVFEVYKRLARAHGKSAAEYGLGVMLLGQHVPLTTSLALRAVTLSEAHRLPLADSIILATARAAESILWTQDAHFEGLSDVRYFKK